MNLMYHLLQCPNALPRDFSTGKRHNPRLILELHGMDGGREHSGVRIVEFLSAVVIICRDYTYVYCNMTNAETARVE